MSDNIGQAVEYLENALFNCDNIKRLGVQMVDMVKEQIQSAINELNKEGEE